MTELERQLEAIEDHDLIYPAKGAITIDSRAKHYPEVDIHFLAQLLDDYMFNWDDAKKEYLETLG